MEFIKALKEVGEVKSLYKVRQFYHLFVGEVELSIQASEFHYSMPRETLENIEDYDSFEVALIGSKNKYVIEALEEYADFDIEDLDDINEDSILVFSFVPKELIEDLYNKLNKKSKHINKMKEVF